MRMWYINYEMLTNLGNLVTFVQHGKNPTAHRNFPHEARQKPSIHAFQGAVA